MKQDYGTISFLTGPIININAITINISINMFINSTNVNAISITANIIIIITTIIITIIIIIIIISACSTRRSGPPGAPCRA